MTRPIPAITVHQPWATLIALGAKRFETRSWQTQLRGTLAIHAGRDTDALAAFNAYLVNARAWSRDQWRNAILSGGMGRFAYHAAHALNQAGILRASQLPIAAVVCIVRLIDCHPVQRIADSLSPQERAFGDFTAGRFAWEMEVIQRFDQPIPARGQQGIWGWQPPASIEVQR